METRDVIELTLTVASGIAVITGIVGAVIYGLRRGTRQEKNEVISSAAEITAFWKSQAEDYKKMNEALVAKMDAQKADYTTQIHALSKELSEIRGKFDQTEKQKLEYLSILQNRDPALTEYIKFARETTISFQAIVKSMIEDIRDIKVGVGKIIGKRAEDEKPVIS